MASGVYNTYKAKDGNDWAAGADSAYKCLLVTSSYTPNPDHDFVADVSPGSNEITGGGYARQNMASRAKSIVDGSDRAEHSANNPIFSSLSGPAAPRYAIVYRVVSTDSDHQLVAWIDLGAGLSIVGDLEVKWNGSTTSGLVFYLS